MIVSRLLRPANFQRAHDDGNAARVTNAELFLDLVFVYAITQISNYLLANSNPHGVVRTIIVFSAVWWLWICTSWATNRVSPDRTPVRFALFGIMGATLAMAIALPQAFSHYAMAFALCYVGAQTGRSLFMVWALAGADPALRANFFRVFLWFCLSAPLWLLGALEQGTPLQAWLWGIAVAIEYSGPYLGFMIPKLGRTHAHHWGVSGGHLAERCALFVIIALGETLVMTAAPLGQQEAHREPWMGFLSAFLSTVAMWWVYFDKGMERGTRRIAETSDPGRMARTAYTYIHGFIIAGIVVTAVSDRVMLRAPMGVADPHDAAFLIGGPALYLLGAAAFKTVIYRRVPLSHLLGLALVMATAIAYASSLVGARLHLSLLTTGIMIFVAIWEHYALSRPD